MNSDDYRFGMPIQFGSFVFFFNYRKRAGQQIQFLPMLQSHLLTLSP